jgi:hypothetical protein
MASLSSPATVGNICGQLSRSTSNAFPRPYLGPKLVLTVTCPGQPSCMRFLDSIFFSGYTVNLIEAACLTEQDFFQNEDVEGQLATLIRASW